MKTPCKSGPSLCCKTATYWREMSQADAARNELLTAECEALHEIVDQMRSALRSRDAEIQRLQKHQPTASKYGLREIRRRA